MTPDLPSGVSPEEPVESMEERSPSSSQTGDGLEVEGVACRQLGVRQTFHPSRIPLPRLPHKDPEPLLDPFKVIPQYQKFTEQEIQNIWDKIEASLKNSDPAVQKDGVVLFCNTAVTCADDAEVKDLKLKAKPYLTKGLLPNAAVQSRGKILSSFNQKIREFLARLATQRPSSNFIDEMENFKEDPVNKAVFRLFPKGREFFETLVHNSRLRSSPSP